MDHKILGWRIGAAHMYTLRWCIRAAHIDIGVAQMNVKMPIVKVFSST